MANKGLEMYNIKQIIKLHNDGKSYREICMLLGISRKCVTKYVLLYKSIGIDYDTIKQKSEGELEILMRNQELPSKDRFQILLEQCPEIEKELKRTGVTKQLLWSEYKIRHPDGYNYTQYCQHYKNWLKANEVTMHLEHKSGDKMYVDFTGKKLQYVNKATSEVIEVEVFIAILGASQLTYIEAVPSQKTEHFIKAVENALRYFGGVPLAIVPDNLKAAVTKASKYEAELNMIFADFSEHYNTTILPTRSYKPRDKALVESAVNISYTRVFATLRNEQFFSIQDLNTRILEKLDIHNNTKFQNKDYSRRELFTEIEEQELQELPIINYEIKRYSQATVYKNSHIWFGVDEHYYSIPYSYIGQKVKIQYTNSALSIYCKGERIAYHQRNYGKYQYTTNAEHLPSTHQFVSQWSPEKFITWARAIGAETETVINEVLSSKKHPEQAYKSCIGILSYGKKVGYERLNRACNRAIQFNSYNYRTIKNILASNYDKISLEDEIEYQTPNHENIRGAQYYGKI